VKTHADPARTAPAAESPDQLARAIVRHLQRTGIPVPAVHLIEADGDVPGAVLLSGSTRGRVVAAAVDDDTGPHRVIRYAAAQARSLGLPLRIVHVWTGRATDRDGVRLTRHDVMSHADLLLSEVLNDHLTAAEAGTTEREILHDPGVVPALIALSAEARLLVVAARSSPAATAEPLGDTVRGLVGRTACPLAVVSPSPQPPVTRGAW
jgi:hypothetical protein